MFVSSVAAARVLVVPTTAYANAGGTGDRTASITVTSNITWDSGANSNLVNGSQTGDSTNAVDTPGGGGAGSSNDGDYVRFDFRSGVQKYIDELKLYASTTPAHGAWKIQASNDASTWTDLSSFTWDAATKTVTLTGMQPDGYRYFQMIKVGAGAWTNLWFSEVEFKIAPGAT